MLLDVLNGTTPSANSARDSSVANFSYPLWGGSLSEEEAICRRKTSLYHVWVEFLLVDFITRIRIAGHFTYAQALNSIGVWTTHRLCIFTFHFFC